LFILNLESICGGGATISFLLAPPAVMVVYFLNYILVEIWQ